METLCFNLFAIAFVLLAILYRRNVHKLEHWDRMGIVSEKSYLPFGNIINSLMMRRTLGETYKLLYEKYRSERFIGVYRMSRLDLIVMDPVDIKRVLITDFNNFKDRVDFVTDDREPLFFNLFNAHAKQWRPMRQTVSPAFSTSKLKSMLPLILDVGDQLSKYLEHVTTFADNETELLDVMSKFTADVIGTCGFGVKLNSMLDDNAPFRQMGRKFFTQTPYQFVKLVIKMNFPWFYTKCNLRVHSMEVQEYFSKTVTDIIRERESSGRKRNDFIDMMLEFRAKQKSSGDLGDQMLIDDGFICAQAFIFFLAGFETSSTFMSFTLHELAHNPDIQDKVYEEIHTVLDKYDGKMSYDIISEMTYLDMVVSEAQRKYPALGNLFRMCTQTYTFPGSKVTVEPMTWVSIPVLAIHYDPKYYPEPEKFIPERFSPEAKAQRDPMLYLPFGDGPRNCVALRLGKMQSIIGLITVLKDFYVEPCAKTISKIVLNPTSFVTHSKHGVWLNLKRRSNV